MFQLTRFSHNTVFFRNQNARYAGTRCNYFLQATPRDSSFLVDFAFFIPFVNKHFLISRFFVMSDNISKVWFEMKSTKLYSKMLLVKSSENNFIFLPAFYLIMCLMKASKNFGKIAILKILELVSLGGAKTNFGKITLK